MSTHLHEEENLDSPNKNNNSQNLADFNIVLNTYSAVKTSF